MKESKNFLAMVFFLSLFSCGSSEKTLDEHGNSVQVSETRPITIKNEDLAVVAIKEGLSKTRKLGNYLVNCRYFPLEASKNAKGMQFNLSISRPDNPQDLLKLISSDQEQYAKYLKYFSFKAFQDVALVHDGDTIPSIGNIMVRDYGVKPSIDLVFYFDQEVKTLDKETKFVFDDAVFGLGRIKFTFNKLSEIQLVDNE